MDDIRNIIITEIFDIVLSAIILKIYFKTFFTEKEVKYIRVYIPTIMYIGWQILLMRGIELPVYCKMLISTILITINYICLFDYLFISSQMSAKPYFIGSTGILLLW